LQLDFFSMVKARLPATLNFRIQQIQNTTHGGVSVNHDLRKGFLNAGAC
jgi:hypothetical protein